VRDRTRLPVDLDEVADARIRKADLLAETGE
jgi:hypothetical protein